MDPTRILEDTGWMKKALCQYHDRTLFFPSGKDQAAIDQATRICRFCTVFDECDQYARDEQYGVWAGRWRG